jgi:RimJ/RimL family protein N-acetyltransferase
MGNAVAGVEQSEVVLSVECTEPEGQVVRHVRRCELSFEKLRFLWEKLSPFHEVFNAPHQDFGQFVSLLIATNGEGNYEPTGLFWEVDDVGILYITDIRPGFEATAHFSFWDRRYRGREPLIMAMVKYVFALLELRRITVEIPMYAHSLRGFVERMGFVHEGRRREAIFHKDKWFDSNVYSLLRRDV